LTKIGYKIVTFGFARFFSSSVIFREYAVLYYAKVKGLILIFWQKEMGFCGKLENSHLCGKLCGKCGKGL